LATSAALGQDEGTESDVACIEHRDLVTLDEAGNTGDRTSAERLEVVWPEGEELLLMDDAIAQALAPNGILDEVTAAASEEEGFVYEFGPPL
jgi:hypothetical protein